MNHFPNRLRIFIKDIMLITGQSERTAQRIMRDIRLRNRLSSSKFITIEHFCEFMGMKEESVRIFLK